MTDYFFNLASISLSPVGFIVFLSLVGASFITTFVLSLCGIITKNKCLIFNGCVTLGLSVILGALAMYFELLPYKALCVLGEGLLLCSAFTFVSQGDKRSCQDLIRDIDCEIAKSNSPPAPSPILDFNASQFGSLSTAIEEKPKKSKLPVQSVKVGGRKSEKEINKPEVDYSHVRNILERLDYYSLTGGDKRTVCELENSLLLAEKGDNTGENKIRINDGLSALLKIMSKYGV